MGQGIGGHGLDFGQLQDSQVGLPLMKRIQRIVVGTEVLRDGAVASNGVVEHSAKGVTVDRAGMQAKPNDPTSALIHDDQRFGLAQKRLSKGRFVWWPSGKEATRRLQAHQAQLLLAAGNPEAAAAPVWREVST
ncbi:MAG TPA: IS66 family insertion sequence element accessory protein TnpB [Terriglobia bacterium]|nr:IS66 family insertion sequence element accessory protein TnpB [Terriglobia bacterium]